MLGLLLYSDSGGNVNIWGVTLSVIVRPKLHMNIGLILNSFRYRAEGKRLLGRHRRKRDDNVKIAIQEVGWRGLSWLDLV
jgi:hypothetical protein